MADEGTQVPSPSFAQLESQGLVHRALHSAQALRTAPTPHLFQTPPLSTRESRGGSEQGSLPTEKSLLLALWQNPANLYSIPHRHPPPLLNRRVCRGREEGHHGGGKGPGRTWAQQMLSLSGSQEMHHHSHRNRFVACSLRDCHLGWALYYSHEVVPGTFVPATCTLNLHFSGERI